MLKKINTGLKPIGYWDWNFTLKNFKETNE